MKQLSQTEIKQMLHEVSSGKKDTYKMKGHSFQILKGTGKQFCTSCGLVALNNQITQWCINKGCNYSDHPQFKSTLKRLTKS